MERGFVPLLVLAAGGVYGEGERVGNRSDCAVGTRVGWYECDEIKEEAKVRWQKIGVAGERNS